MQAGPYGITQVDVPGIYGAYQQMQENRIRMMLVQKQMDAAERDAQKQKGVSEAIRRYAPGGAQEAPATSYAKPSDVAPEDQALLRYASPDQLTGQPPARPAPRRPEGDRRQLFNDLLALDPETAGQVATALKSMDEATVSQEKQRNDQLGTFAFHILYDERGNPRSEADMAAIYRQVAPQIIESGLFSEEEVGAFQPSREGLLQILRQAQDIDKLIQITKPDLMAVGPMEVLIDKRNPEAGAVFKSPVPKIAQGPNGETVLLEYEDGQGGDLPRVSTPEEAKSLPPGSQFIMPDGRIGTVPGGPAASPPGGFP